MARQGLHPHRRDDVTCASACGVPGGRSRGSRIASSLASTGLAGAASGGRSAPCGVTGLAALHETEEPAAKVKRLVREVGVPGPCHGGPVRAPREEQIPG